jgi:hypothetical protein
MWIVLVVDTLMKEHDKGRTARRLLRKLSEISGDLHELFRDILTRDFRNREELPLYPVASLARQPLKPEQLYFAALSGTDPEDMSAWDLDEMSMDTIKRLVLNSSNRLAEVSVACSLYSKIQAFDIIAIAYSQK